LVLAHHLPGWDEWYKETTLRFARAGYATLCPNLYYRSGHGTPEDVAAKARAAGGVPDDQAVGDLAGAARFLRAQPTASGKVGIFGTCSGGRHAYLTACRAPILDAVVDCWGGRVVMKDEELTPNQPVAPLTYTQALACPLLGIFGNDDQGPTPEQVNRHEEELKKLGKVYEFHRYANAGHGFFYHHRPAYRQEQAVDGWNKVFAFLEKYLKLNAG
jgi:carboxymethylenebutenolidase